MDLIRTALKNPGGVAAVVLLSLAFGLLALLELPLQLFPDMEQPQMSVQTSWRAATPREIEAEILKPQEDVLRGLPGLEQIEANANPGNAWVNLRFAVGTDLQEVLIEVLGRLNRLPPMPEDSDPPTVRMNGNGANDTLSWFFVQLLPGTAGTVADHRQFVDDVVRPRLEAVPGVASVELNIDGEAELAVELDPARAAALGIELSTIASRMAQSRDSSGGFKESGRRRFALRFSGRYSPQELGELVLSWREGRPVYLRDVATISVRTPERQFMSWQNGNPAIGLRLVRMPGANVLATLGRVQEAVAELRSGVLAERGLAIEQSFDAALFIHRAVNLLSGNLIAGVLLSVGCLWWFLRDRRATLLIGSAIPISLLATFIVLKLTGRSLNVVSLAGLAFAVGMVMDAAIVVAENIVRLRERGLEPTQAADRGTREVAGALFASTLTTVAVFAPVMFLAGAEGQLFADLALTITIATLISLLVAVTVMPAAAGRFLRPASVQLQGRGYGKLGDWITRLTATRKRQWTVVSVGLALPIALIVAWMPSLDYLPPVKRAAIDAIFQFPPGMSTERVDREIGTVLRERMAPYMDGSKQPQLKNWYLLLWPGGGTIGARVVDEARIGELENIIRNDIIVGLPDTTAFAFEGELFGGVAGSSRSIQMHIQSADLDAAHAAAQQASDLLKARFAGANVQVTPNPDAREISLEITPDDRALAEAGWTRSELAATVRALGEGLWLGEYFDGDKQLNIILRGAGWETPEELGALPIHTRNGFAQPLGTLAQISTRMDPAQLRRIDGRRAVSLGFDPPADVPLDVAIQTIEREVLPQLRSALPADASIQISGSADQLDTLLQTMAKNVLMALLVLFVLMAVMLRSALDSAVVMATLPLAILGGVIGVRVLGWFAFQPLDLMTMIGFVMLLGMVVNNGILLVSQTRSSLLEGLHIDAAVRQALDARLRPILIGALTGVVGALPMAINPGPGAVIYRGLAAVTVGGVSFSLIFTALLVPALMKLLAGRRSAKPAEQTSSTPTQTQPVTTTQSTALASN